MRVLIAHANEAARTKLADVVTRGRRLSLDVQTVGDGPEALDLLLAEDPPEVALVDWDLPGIEAPEMCRLVRDFHHHHDTWIIVLASRAHQEDSREVWVAGADDCVYTPAAAKLLSDRVTKGLCEMAPPIHEAAMTAASGAAPAAPPPAGSAEAAAVLAAAVDEESGATAAAAPFPSARPTLDAVARCDGEVGDHDGFCGLAADLKATVDADDPGEPAELSAGPVTLAAQRLEPDDAREPARGSVTLDAVLAQL